MRAPFVNNTDPMPSDWADIAFNYLKDGHYGKLASYTRSIRPRQSASARDLGFLNYFCSRVLFSEGEHEQSFRKLHRAADIFNDVKEKVWNVIAVHRLANDYSKVGDTKNSRKYFELSLSLALDDEELSFLFSEIQGDYGCMLFSHGIDSRRALDFTEQALGKSQQVGNESTAFKLAVNKCAPNVDSPGHVKYLTGTYSKEVLIMNAPQYTIESRQVLNYDASSLTYVLVNALKVLDSLVRANSVPTLQHVVMQMSEQNTQMREEV